MGSIHMFCACFMFLFAFSFVLVGELFIAHIRNQRNHKRQTERHLQPKPQVTVMTWNEANTQACRKSACQAKQAKHMSAVQQLKA